MTACCLPQPYKPTPAARAIAIATALRINAVLFLLFFLLRQVVTWCPRPPWSLQPRRRFFLVPSLWLPVMRVIVMPVKAHRCQRYRRLNVLPASSRASFAKRSLTTNSRQRSNQCSRYHCGISDQSCCNISPLVTTTVVTSRDCQRIASSAPS